MDRRSRYTTATLRRLAVIHVAAERRLQIIKWGDQMRRPHYEWLAILTEEVGEAAQALLDGRIEDAEHEVEQCAAVAQAWLEKFIKERTYDALHVRTK